MLLIKGYSEDIGDTYLKKKRKNMLQLVCENTNKQNMITFNYHFHLVNRYIAYSSKIPCENV